MQPTFRQIDEQRSTRAAWIIAAVLALGVGGGSTSTFAQTATFNPTSGTPNYNLSTNWTPATVPNSSGASATFNSPTATETVSTSAATIVGNVNLADGGAFVFTLANGTGGSLAFQVPTGNAAFNVTGTSTAIDILSAPATLTSTLDFNISDTAPSTTGALQITGALTGAGGIIKDGNGAASLATNAKTYTGSTIINGGILRTSVSGEATMTSGVTVNSGGTLSIAATGTSQTVQFGTSTATIITLNGAGTTYQAGTAYTTPIGALTATGNASTLSNNIVLASNSAVSPQVGLTLSGNISGTYSLTTAGQGSSTLVLSGTNSFSGGLIINTNEVDVSSDSNLGGAGGSITINGSRLGVTASTTIDPTRAILLGSNSTGSSTGSTFSTPGSSTVVAYNGSFQDLSGSVGDFVKQGGGTLQIGGSSSYSGNTFLNNGTTQLTIANNRLPMTTVVNLGQAGSSASSGSNNVGALDLNGFNQQIAGLSSTTYLGTGTLPGKNTVTSSTGAATLTLNVSGSNSYSYGSGTTANSGVITGTVSLVKSGTGTQTLGDTNTYTGATQIGGGTLVLSSTGSINGSTLVQVGVAGSTTTNVGALTLNNAASLADTGTLSLVSGTTLNLSGANGTSETIGNLILDGTVEPANTYTASQLMALDPNISFTSSLGETLTIAAVPEPATVFGGLLLVVALGWKLRRRSQSFLTGMPMTA